MRLDGGFRFARVDILAAADDHILAAVDVIDEAVFILIGDVAGAERAADFSVDERIARGLGLAPIAAHDVRAARHDLTGRSDGPPPAFSVADGELDSDQRPA